MLISYSQLLKVIEASGQSYEQLAARIGLSGMTLRRWLKNPSDQPLPLHCQSAVSVAIRQLVDEGLLPKNSEVAAIVIQKDSLAAAENTMKHLGLNLEFVENKSGLAVGDKENQNLILDGLSQIGSAKGVAADVDQSRSDILRFCKKGLEWKRMISFLLKVIKSKKATKASKIVAYGALFYLLNPLDFIPDYIVGFGLIDDYSILGIASAYCLKLWNAFGDA